VRFTLYAARPTFMKSTPGLHRFSSGNILLDIPKCVKTGKIIIYLTQNWGIKEILNRSCGASLFMLFLVEPIFFLNTQKQNSGDKILGTAGLKDLYRL
jgi:hypothetical protein